MCMYINICIYKIYIYMISVYIYVCVNIYIYIDTYIYIIYIHIYIYIYSSCLLSIVTFIILCHNICSPMLFMTKFLTCLIGLFHLFDL